MAEKTEDDLLLEIAEQIEMNRVGYREKTDEEKAELIPGIKIIATKKLQEISISFNRVIGHLGDNVPEETRMLILRGISEKVSSDDKVKTIDGAFSTETIGLAENIISVEKERILREEELTENENVNSFGNILEDKDDKENIDKEVKLEEELSEKYGDYFSSIDGMKQTVRNIEDIFAGLNQEKFEEMINSSRGDPKNPDVLSSRLAITGIMTALSFTNSRIPIEKMSSGEKENAYRTLYQLSLIDEKYPNTEVVAVQRQLAEKLKLDIIEKTADGSIRIDKEKLIEIAKKDKIDLEFVTIEYFEKDATASYVAPESAEDAKLEVQIQAATKEMQHNRNIFTQELRNGRDWKELLPRAKEMLSLNKDAEMRILDYMASELESSVVTLVQGEEELTKEMIMFALQDLRNAQLGKNDLVIDSCVMNYVDRAFHSLANYMKNGKYDKKMIDLMLEIDPERTQMYLQEKTESTPSKEYKTNSNVEEKKELTEEQLYQNLANTLNQRVKSRGLVETLEYVNGSIKSQNDMDDAERIKKRYVSGALIMLDSQESSYDDEEREGRKKLFERILLDKIYDESILKQMIEIDSTTTKEILDELLIQQNQSKENNLGTIMDLSQKMKEVSDSKVLSADNVQIEVVAEEFGKTDKFRSIPDDDETR